MYDKSITPESLPPLCKKYYNGTDYLKPKLIQPDDAWGLWPGLVRDVDVKDGETLFGFYDALDVIYKHQHPENCSQVKFLVSGGYPSGYGSQVHVEGQGLAAALDSGRVFLRHPGPPTNLRHFFGWQTNTALCKAAGTDTLDCYYRPWSSCTLADAVGAEKAQESGWGPLRDVKVYRPGEHVEDKVLTFRHMEEWADEHSKDVPRVFQELLDCSPMRRDFRFYWLRAMFSAYLLRPNDATLRALEEYRTVPLGASNGHGNGHRSCVAMHVRHGDKHSEMKLVPFSSYVAAADDMWRKGLVHGAANGTTSSAAAASTPATAANNGGYDLFVTTEDPSVVRECEQFNADVKDPHGPGLGRCHYTQLFDRAAVTAAGNADEQKAEIWGDYRSDPAQYLSILLNLEYALRCDAWACTLASNSCRLIDELRATVGGKANYAFADLSIETCRRPPCYDGEDIYWLDWRRRRQRRVRHTKRR